MCLKHKRTIETNNICVMLDDGDLGLVNLLSQEVNQHFTTIDVVSIFNFAKSIVHASAVFYSMGKLASQKCLRLYLIILDYHWINIVDINIQIRFTF